MDPYTLYSDSEIWEVIYKVGLGDVVLSLDTIVENNGKNLSAGQTQLLCLARASLSKCRILLIDEANSNIDAETDKMLYKVVNDFFSNCTVLMIAHKMHSILECDKVLVLENGKIVEFDNPGVLLSTKNSVFKRLYEHI